MNTKIVEENLKNLKRFFDEVSLFDLDEKIKFSFDRKGVLSISDIKKTRENALILNNALKEKKRLVEMDYIDGKTFETITIFQEFDGKSVVLKLKLNVGESVVVNAKGAGDLVEMVMEHNMIMYKDPLTSVYNRGYFDSHLMGTDVNAIAMIDVDDFKDVNDTYGHQIGDEVLKVIAQTIEKSAKKVGTTVRYGGDEFVVVFHEITKTNFKEVLKKICEDVNKIKIKGIKTKLSVSVGGVYGFENLKDMIGKADSLMYDAKKTKNSFAYANSKDI